MRLTLIHESLAWKCFVLNVPEIKPSSMPRAAPIIPNEKVANHSLQLLTSFGSSPIESLKMLVGFLAPAPILIGLCRASCYNCALWCRKVRRYSDWLTENKRRQDIWYYCLKKVKPDGGIGN